MAVQARNRPRLGESVVLLTLLAVSVVAFFFDMPVGDSLDAGVSRTWATIVFVLLWTSLLLTALRMFNSTERPAAWTDADRAGWLPVGLTLGYIVLIPVVGFTIATLVSITALFWALGVKPIAAVLRSIILSAVLNVIFTTVLYLPLPRGIGPFEEFSVHLFTLLTL